MTEKQWSDPAEDYFGFHIDLAVLPQRTEIISVGARPQFHGNTLPQRSLGNKAQGEGTDAFALHR